jgi:two-component system cell cycle response regulator DivK
MEKKTSTDERPILIVDDNLINLKLAKVVLEMAGFTTVTATAAEDALIVLFNTMPSLILMDIQLPRVSGLELTQQLRADARYRDIPILAITAYAREVDKEKALAAGCNGYIAKPIEIATFPSVISEYIH